MYSHFLVREDNQNKKKKKKSYWLGLQNTHNSIFFKHWLTFSFKCENEVREYATNISTFIFQKGKFYNF